MPYDTEWTHDELFELDKETLVQRCLGLQRAYTSLYNAVTLYKRQLTAVRDKNLKSGQIANLSRKVNIADTKVIAAVVATETAGFFGCTYGALFLYDEETRLLTLRSSSPEVAGQHALDYDNDADVMVMDVLRTQPEPLVISSRKDYEILRKRDFRPIAAEEPLEKGGLLCPLSISTQEGDPIPVGVALFGGREEGFDRHDIEVATMLSEMIATAISTAHLIEQMHQLAETDGLTGLYNHRHFQQELNRALVTAERYKTPVSLLMIDIDNFKRINDQHGHQAGDHILREVARMLRLSVRDTVDIAARYGGEEFAVIMPNTEIEGAMVAAERIRQCVESTRLTIAGQALHLTISLGVACHEAGQNKGEFVDAADTALYSAKRNGRNRVEQA